MKNYDNKLRKLKEILEQDPTKKKRIQTAWGFHRVKMSRILNGHTKLTGLELLILAETMPDNPFGVVLETES